jgi:hypothetical protein
MPKLRADGGLHTLRGRLKVGNGGADASFKVTAFEGFIVQPPLLLIIRFAAIESV